VKFDKEYSTQFKDEVEYLKSIGIRYTFVKDISGISTYKYTRTPALFYALASFYEGLDRGGLDDGKTDEH
jgi:hypothetical protein